MILPRLSRMVAQVKQLNRLPRSRQSLTVTLSSDEGRLTSGDSVLWNSTSRLVSQPRHISRNGFAHRCIFPGSKTFGEPRHTVKIPGSGSWAARCSTRRSPYVICNAPFKAVCIVWFRCLLFPSLTKGLEPLNRAGHFPCSMKGRVNSEPTRRGHS